MLTPGHTVPDARRSALGPVASWLDLVRGTAAVLVCAGHLRSVLFEDSVSLGGRPWLAPFYFCTSLGHEAVMVFFVLSGFLVGGGVLREFSLGRFLWYRYLLARFSRLWVVLLPALGLTMAFDFAGLALFGSGGIYSGEASYGHVLPPGIEERLDGLTLLGNALFTQNILVSPLGSNGALWSLANEAWYYILFPIAVSVAHATRVRGRLGAALALIALGAFAGQGILVYSVPWLLGVAVARAQQGRAERRPSGSGKLTSAGLVGILLCLAATKTLRMGGLAADLIVSIVAASWLLLTLRHPPPTHMPRWLASIARSLSDISFSLYATHLPLVVFIAAARGPQGRWAPTLSALALYACVLAGVLVYSKALWWCFESRTEAVRSRLLPRAASNDSGRDRA